MKNNKTLHALVNTGKVMILPLIVFVVFAILTNGRSATSRMMLTTLRQSIVPMMICWGLMFTMTMGMFNFSAGAVMLCAGIIGGNLAKITDTGMMGLLFFCILIALVSSFGIGFLYNKMRVPCMVLTIGLMLVFEALPRALFTGGVRISGSAIYLAVSPNIFYTAVVMLVVFYIVYNMLPLGHNMRALGASPTISANVGIDADSVKLKAFVWSGLFFGVGAALYIASSGEVRNVSALGSMTIVMDGFMGMFLALFMTRYTNLAIAVPISSFCMKMITNGFVALGMSGTIRDLTNGVFLLILLTISANSGLIEGIRANRRFAEKIKSEIKITL